MVRIRSLGYLRSLWQVDCGRLRNVTKFMYDCVSTVGRLDQIDPLSNGASAQHHASDPGARAETTVASDWPCSGLTECIDVWPLVSVKPVKQRFCLANVGNLKALRECPVHRFKDLPCVGLPVLPDPETRKA